MSAGGTSIIAIVLPPVRIIVVPSIALVTFNKVLSGMALSAPSMQVSDLMQRINFTMPKFKDHEKGNLYHFQPPRKGFENKDRKFFVNFLTINL